MTETKNRDAIRKAVAGLFEAGLVGAGLPVAEVADCQKSVISQTPLVEVLSAGSSRTHKGIGSKKYKNIFYLELHTLIRDSDESGLTDGEREDRLDLIDKMIADILLANESGELWDRLSFAGENGNQGERSKATKVIWDGKAYLFEVHQLEVLVND
jgi:hypothetical protein